MQRCYADNNISYRDYGGRGITVCDKWKKVEGFIEDMGKRPIGKTLDRIDNDGNYCRENCKWSTPKEQARNRRNSIYIEYNGENLMIAEWAEKVNIKEMTIRSRFSKGWDAEKILTTPTNDLSIRSRPSVMIEYKNEIIALSDLARKFNIKYYTLRRRLKNGWDLEKALNTPIVQSTRWHY